MREGEPLSVPSSPIEDGNDDVGFTSRTVGPLTRIVTDWPLRMHQGLLGSRREQVDAATSMHMAMLDSGGEGEGEGGEMGAIVTVSSSAAARSGGGAAMGMGGNGSGQV